MIPKHTIPQIDKSLVSDELDEILSANPDDETQKSWGGKLWREIN